ncbi:MAG: hypothetical protein JSR17_02405 [Proteobacteria bacterium]|nr:hypothetical protein [Pseudomonadota bacterium]
MASKSLKQDPIFNTKIAEQIQHLIKKKKYETLELEKEALLEDYRKKEIAANKIYFLRKAWEKKLRDDIFNLNKALQEAEFALLKKSIPKNFLNALLLTACQDQDWVKALIFISVGAKMGPEGKAFLDIDLNRFRGNFLHPIKEFGLVLGIKAVSEDGTYSGVARIGPTYHLMAETIQNYADYKQDEEFKLIADAFHYTDHHANYDGSIHDKGLSKKLLARIQDPSATLTSVPTGCVGHAMAVTVVRDPNPPGTGGYIVFTNRWSDPSTSAESGTHIYRIKDLSLINKAFIDTMVDGVFKSSYATIVNKIESIADPHVPPVTINQAPQKCYNCTIASPRANIHGILLCLKAIQQKQLVSELDSHDKTVVYDHFKDFTHRMRRDKIQELAQRITNTPKDPYYNDLVTLAKEFIKQHPEKDEEYKNILIEALEEENLKPTLTSRIAKPKM